MHTASAVQENGGNSGVSLNSRILATAKIGQILPLWHAATLPGDKFHVNLHQFSRFEPLAVPAYVNLTYRTMSVFVPYHQIMDGSDAFFSNHKKFKGMSCDIPVLTANNMYNFFMDSTISYAEVDEPNGWFDFKTAQGSTITPRRFTAVGRYCAKVLQLLGYRWKTNTLAFPSDGMNALPLLAFAHAYNCYLSYSVRYNTSGLSSVLETLKRSPAALSVAQIKTILTSILLTYEESFASSCWKSPYMIDTSSAPILNDIRQDDFQVADPSGNHVVGLAAGTGAQVVMNDGEALTSDQVRLVMKFDEYFRRSNYAGSKDVQEIYSRFGRKIDDYRTRYPYFLGESSQDVQIGDVTSTSDTHTEESVGAVVGSYAGKAISNGDSHFNFEANDYGMLFIFAWYAPKPIYFTGFDKECLRLQPMDFYTPELDQGFASAVQKWQINSDGNNPNNVFGYMPLYSEYLFANDYIVGDFARYNDFGAWHFGRQPSSLGEAAAQSDALIYLPQGGTEYERIFNITDPELVDADTIYMTCFADVSASRPMRDFSGKAMLGSGDIDIQRNGSQLA